MKYRRVSLINYIFFLFVMYIAWYYTIRSKKHGGYNLQGIDSLIEKLNENIQPILIFQIDPKFDQKMFQQFNSTIYDQFKKGIYSIIVNQQPLNNSINLDAATVLIQIIFDQNNDIMEIKDLQIITIKTTNPESVQLKKNLKRYINKFMPFVQNENQLENQQIYLNRLLIFDFFVVNNTQTFKFDDVENSIQKMVNLFGLNNSQIRINYKNLPIANLSSLTKQQYQGILEDNEQIQDMNWKEYFQLNILLIAENNTFTYEEEEYSFLFQEPNNFIHSSRNKQDLNSNIFDTFMQLLQIEEKTEILLENNDYEPTLQLISKHFRKREQLRLFNNFIRELLFMKYISDEGDYQITKESQYEFEQRVQFIMESLIQIWPTNTVNILNDDRFSDLDTFSFEYTMGTYLPLILPFAYPILLGVYDELAQK